MNSTVANVVATHHLHCDTMIRPPTARSAIGLSQGHDNALLKACFWNAGGLTSDKFVELKTIIIKNDIDIYGIVEAGASTDSPQYFQVPGYQTFVLPRARQVASGIIVAVRTTLVARFNVVKERSERDKLEAVQIDVWKDKFHRRFTVMYNPPTNKPELSWLEATWGPNDILYGDLNAPSTKWSYPTTSPVGQIFEDFVDANPVNFLDNEEKGGTFIAHNGTCSHPDIILVHSSMENEVRHTVSHAPGSIGHKILNVDILRRRPKDDVHNKAVWNLKKANWNLYTKLSDEQVGEISCMNNVDCFYKRIRQAIISCAMQAIPKGRVKRYSPFWSEKLQTLKEVRDQLREIFEQTRLLGDKQKLQKAAGKLRKEIKEAKRNTYRTFLEELDYRKDGVEAHQFLSKLNSQGEPCKSPPVITPSGKLLTSKKDIANHFCAYYAKASNFHPKSRTKENYKRAPATCENEFEDSLFNTDFSLAELNDAIGKIQHQKSAGPDEILPEFITHLGTKARKAILTFLNTVWKTGIPSEWRKAEVIPIPKKGKTPDCPENCRPIALTSVFSKLFERLLLDRLEVFLDVRKLISGKQAGFRKHRNTIEHVAYLSQEIKNGFNRKQSTVAIFIDFKAAFDRVYRNGLFHKIRRQGITGNMYKSLYSFLSQRFIRVKYHNNISRYKQTRQGVPQGSVLSPTLFSIMINDAVAALESIPGVRTLLYADDLVVWATSSDLKAVEDCLNGAMLVLRDWVSDNSFEVNTSKTMFQVFTLSTKRQDITIKFNEVPLAKTNSATYLGVALDNRLTWKNHVEKLAQQGENRLRLLKRLAGISWGARQDILTLAYKSYIRPSLEYGCEVLLTATDSVLKALDIVQNKALRLVTGGAKSTPIPAMEIQTGVEPLKIRREMAAVSMFERVRRLRVEHWDLQETSALRLKTQKPLASKVEEIIAQHGLQLEARQVLPDILSLKLKHVAEFKLDLLHSVSSGCSKADTPEWELRALAQETICTRYPAEQWLHLYTDGSAQSSTSNAGAGVYCASFSLFAPAGANSTNFDGEVKAISMALIEVSKRTAPLQLVIFVDSQAAIIAVSSRHYTDSKEVIDARKNADWMISGGYRVVLQWIPGHCGLFGNDQADGLARQGALQQQPHPPLPLSSAKRLIKSRIKELVRVMRESQVDGKSWESLLDTPLPLALRRAEMVAAFRMMTGHDFLQAHLFRIGVVESPNCPLCRTGDMDAQHLLRCAGLADIPINDMDNREYASKLYWVARRRMTTNQ